MSSFTSSCRELLSLLFHQRCHSSVEMVILWMSIFICEEITSDTERSIPCLSIPRTLMVALKNRRLCMSHLASNILLPKLDLRRAATEHERLCTSIRPLLSIYPNASSPGMGWQQVGNTNVLMFSSLITIGIFLVEVFFPTNKTFSCSFPFFLSPDKNGTNLRRAA